MREWTRRFRRPTEEEFAAEIDAHLAHEIDEQVERGVPPERARFAAHRRFGNVTRHMERFREASPWFWFDTLRQDLRDGWRSLRRSPSLSCSAVASLALGIAGSTALVSLLVASVIDPLPFPRSERLVKLVQYDKAGVPQTTYVARDEFVEYSRLDGVFADAAGLAASYVYVNGPERSAVMRLDITCNFFDVLGVAPLIGRGPSPADCRPDAPPTVVLAHRLWTSRFGADPNVIGQVIRLDAQSFGNRSVTATRYAAVIGVMPQRVLYWQEDAWTPTALESEGAPTVWALVARLRDDVGLRRAHEQVTALGSRLLATRPAGQPGLGTPYGVDSIHDAAVRRYGPTLWALVAGAGCILLLACLNVTMLLLARIHAREPEIGLRSSLGASTGRIVRQLTVESLILTACGSVAGMLVAAAVMGPLARMVSASEVLAPQADVRVNGWALIATAVAIAFATLVFGTAPALHALRRDPARALVSGVRATGGRAGSRWRTVLVASQLAVAFPVLCATMAVLLTFVSLHRAAARYAADHVLETALSASEDRFEQQFRDVEVALEAVPGVIGSASTLPVLHSGLPPATIEPLGASETAGWTAQVRGASAGFFSTMRVPLLSGRVFTADDLATRRQVGVISRSFARTYFGTENPLGRQLLVRHPPRPFPALRGAVLEIVGIVDDIPLPGQAGDPVGIVPTLHVPRSLLGLRFAHLLVRTTLPPEVAARDVRRAVGAVFPGLTIGVSPLDASIERNWTAWPRLVAVVAGAFGGVGLLLVLVGLYGVLSYSIAQITREIGVRMALGASPSRIAGHVFGRGMRWTVLGVLGGGAATLVVYRVARSHVWGLVALDATVLASVAGLVLVVAGATSWLPARRAMRVDPAAALRAD